MVSGGKQVQVVVDDDDGSPGLEQPAEAQMFVPHAQMPWPSMAVVIRTPLDAAHVSAAVRQAVWTADNTIPVPPLRPMLGLLGDDHPTHLTGPLAVLAAETAVLSVALVALAIRVTRQRS